ncbi:MAG: cache domain-containing protein, partial [Magnetococcales bacterium]|nr:cache domain-containing protein [Magnetococcales bacterium]
PRPGEIGRKLSGIKDVKGVPLFETMRAAADSDEQNGGFSTHWWNRLNHIEASEKLVLTKWYRPWKVVIGTGAYIDEIEFSAKERRKLLEKELQSHLENMGLGESGQFFLVDAKGTVLSHPDKGMKSSNWWETLDPVSSQPIFTLVKKAASSSKPVQFDWAVSGSGSGNKNVRKVVWARHLKSQDFNWHVGLMIDEEETHRASNKIGQQIIFISVGFLLIAGILAYMFLWHLVNPIKLMAGFAKQVTDGDLDARSTVERNDELGVLSNGFNTMVAQLQDHIATLDKKVQERTSELNEAKTEMEEDLKLSAKMQNSLREAVTSRRFLLEVANQPFRGWVGGDGVSFHKADNGDYWLRVSDGTGHGSSGGTAEIVDSLLFSEIIKQAKGVKEAMQLLVETFNNRFPLANLTYAYFLAKISPDGQVEYVNARQLALHLSGLSQVDTLASQPLVIGHQEDSDSLKPQTLMLNPKDSLLISTDGIFEAQSWNERRKKLTIVGKKAIVQRASMSPVPLLAEIKNMPGFVQNDDILMVKLTRLN